MSFQNELAQKLRLKSLKHKCHPNAPLTMKHDVNAVWLNSSLNQYPCIKCICQIPWSDLMRSFSPCIAICSLAITGRELAFAQKAYEYHHKTSSIPDCRPQSGESRVYPRKLHHLVPGRRIWKQGELCKWEKREEHTNWYSAISATLNTIISTLATCRTTLGLLGHSPFLEFGLISSISMMQVPLLLTVYIACLDRKNISVYQISSERRSQGFHISRISYALYISE